MKWSCVYPLTASAWWVFSHFEPVQQHIRSSRRSVDLNWETGQCIWPFWMSGPSNFQDFGRFSESFHVLGIALGLLSQFEWEWLQVHSFLGFASEILLGEWYRRGGSLGPLQQKETFALSFLIWYFNLRPIIQLRSWGNFVDSKINNEVSGMSWAEIHWKEEANEHESESSRQLLDQWWETRTLKI